jgi:hypothetical protein
MSTNYTIQILEDECIGDSLDTINENFSDLDTAITDLSSYFYSTFFCETSGAGIINRFMSYGSGATNHQGLRMPFSGQIINATLQANGSQGSIIIDPVISGNPNTAGRLSFGSGIASLTGGVLSAFNPPISFNAQDTIAWRLTVPPTSALSYSTVYTVKFFI